MMLNPPAGTQYASGFDLSGGLGGIYNGGVHSEHACMGYSTARDIY